MASRGGAPQSCRTFSRLWNRQALSSSARRPMDLESGFGFPQYVASEGCAVIGTREFACSRTPTRNPLFWNAPSWSINVNPVQPSATVPAENRQSIEARALNAALRNLSYAADVMTSHGFRVTASSMLNESGKWSADAIEAQLAHVEGNAVRRQNDDVVGGKVEGNKG
jgi:hypothetical protein